jgi:hypothetical protein
MKIAAVENVSLGRRQGTLHIYPDILHRWAGYMSTDENCCSGYLEKTEATGSPTYIYTLIFYIGGQDICPQMKIVAVGLRKNRSDRIPLSIYTLIFYIGGQDLCSHMKIVTVGLRKNRPKKGDLAVFRIVDHRKTAKSPFS